MDIQLTQHARFGGCAAKIGPSDLSAILCGIHIPENPNVLVGLKGFEDAGVYRISDELALVQTVDFFTPVVNDPYRFGQIAAANALSDIYAMGAVPVTALNLVCFSPETFGHDVLREILRGGIDKVTESGASLLGGHSVQDQEIKYGLSVTGVIHPEKIVRNEGAKPGDSLILTKPLGTGILITGLKADLVSKGAEEQMAEVMATLNQRASQAMLLADAHAATDVTGFGLAGHLKEMMKEDIGVEIYADRLPCLPETEGLYDRGFLPSGFYKNRDFYAPFVRGEIEGFPLDLIFDPQSSGGLLIAVGEEHMDIFRREASALSVDYWELGRFLREPKGIIRVIP